MRGLLVLLVSGGLGAGTASPAWSQPTPDVAQISNAPASVAVDPVAQATEAAPPAQISRTADSVAGEQQLTTDRASRQQPSQVSRGTRSSEASQPLSRPSEGRTAAVDKVQGDDRCDPAIPAAKRPARCKQVIEARADEFTKSDPTELSPEQKLLLRKEREAAGDDVADATKRLARSGATNDSLTAMGIASIVLNQQQQRKDEKPDDPEAEAATEAIINFLSLTPPQ